MDVSIKEETENSHNLNTVRAPRPSWMEFLLFLTTFSLYSTFWTIGRARDIKNTGERTIKPWLWFFIPLIGVFGAIGFDRLFKALNTRITEEDKKISKFFSGMWLLLFCLITIGFNLDRYFFMPMWLLILAIVILSIMFALFHKQFNNWKHSQSNLKYRGKERSYTWYEILVLIIATPLFLFTFYEYVIQQLYYIGATTYPDGHKVVIQKQGFEFEVSGDKWRLVSSNEDDDHIFHLVSRRQESEVFIYDYEDEYSLADIISYRYDTIMEYHKNAKCDERQTFTSRIDGIHSLIECSDIEWRESYTLIAAAVYVDGRVMEFVGEVLGVAGKVSDPLLDDVRYMAESFQIIKKEGD